MITKQDKKRLLYKINKAEGMYYGFTHKLPITGMFLGMCFGLVFASWSFVRISAFYDAYRVEFHVPVEFRWPVVILPRPNQPPVRKPVEEQKKDAYVPLTPKMIVYSSKYPEFIDHIWFRESGRGTNTNPNGLNMYCKSKGMSNEFGFYPQGNWCFPSFQASVERIEKWYEDNSELTDNQKLCYYNGAGKVNQCAYLSYKFSEMN